jgi:hypothetical protein
VHFLVIVPRLSRLIRLPRQPILVGSLLQRLVIRLPFLRIELLLQIAGRRLVVARLHHISTCAPTLHNVTMRCQLQWDECLGETLYKYTSPSHCSQHLRAHLRMRASHPHPRHHRLHRPCLARRIHRGSTTTHLCCRSRCGLGIVFYIPVAQRARGSSDGSLRRACRYARFGRWCGRGADGAPLALEVVLGLFSAEVAHL